MATHQSPAHHQGFPNNRARLTSNSTELDWRQRHGDCSSGGVTLFAGLFILILAPEFYQPLRDLGTFYHAKQQAVGAAESIVEFLDLEVDQIKDGTQALDKNSPIHIEADQLTIFSPEGQQLAGPLSFSLEANKSTALVGPSGAGKTSLMNALSDRINRNSEQVLEGQILLNDQAPLTQKLFGNYCAYVMQDDIIF